ncbi:hypothetical protein EJ110_NYTH50930 [Nymphaea thermarum]|nr:hypothetical protein EJ110_NYTH50930 [Nymphaea thermarum]
METRGQRKPEQEVTWGTRVSAETSGEWKAHGQGHGGMETRGQMKIHGQIDGGMETSRQMDLDDQVDFPDLGKSGGTTETAKHVFGEEPTVVFPIEAYKRMEDMYRFAAVAGFYGGRSNTSMDYQYVFQTLRTDIQLDQNLGVNPSCNVGQGGKSSSQQKEDGSGQGPDPDPSPSRLSEPDSASPPSSFLLLRLSPLFVCYDRSFVNSRAEGEAAVTATEGGVAATEVAAAAATTLWFWRTRGSRLSRWLHSRPTGEMEYQRMGKKRVEPSTEAQREPSPAHSDAHTPHEDNTSGQQNAQASVGARTPPRQSPPVDQQALLLTTLQTLTSIVQSMAGNQRSQASPTGDTTAPPKEKATTVSFHHFMSMQPPVFTGDGNPDKAEEWIEEIEHIFEVLKVPGGNKVNFGSYMLKGDAKRWWKSTREIQFADQQTIYWRQFRDSFFSTYFPVQARNKKMREFLDLQQNHLSLEEYITKYRHLEAYCPHLYTTAEA